MGARLTVSGRERIRDRALDRLEHRWSSANGSRKRHLVLLLVTDGPTPLADLRLSLDVDESAIQTALSELVEEGMAERRGTTRRRLYAATDHALTTLSAPRSR
jgi:predicted transcriptional regulator